MNVKKRSIYSDKISLNVIDLNRIDLATEEDKPYQLTQEEQIRMQCEAREEYYRIQRYRQHCQEVAEKGQCYKRGGCNKQAPLCVG